MAPALNFPSSATARRPGVHVYPNHRVECSSLHCGTVSQGCQRRHSHANYVKGAEADSICIFGRKQEVGKGEGVNTTQQTGCSIGQEWELYVHAFACVRALDVSSAIGDFQLLLTLGVAERVQLRVLSRARVSWLTVCRYLEMLYGQCIYPFYCLHQLAYFVSQLGFGSAPRVNVAEN